MAPSPPPASPTEKASLNDTDPEASNRNQINSNSNSTKTCGVAAACCAPSRENFLRRLELQQQQQQLTSPPLTDGEEGSEVEEDAGDDLDPPATKKSVEGSEGGIGGVAAATAKSTMLPDAENNQGTRNNSITNDNVTEKDNETEHPSVGDQLLLDYLSQYCNNSTTAAGASSTSDPSEWIQDVDPSSLALLKGLAGIKDETTTTFNPAVAPDMSNAAAPSVPPAGDMHPRGNSNTDLNHLDNDPLNLTTNEPPWNNQILAPQPDEPTKTWEVRCPQGAVPGQPFVLSAGGVRVRVVCPKNARAGQRVRFTLPDTLFTTQVTIDQPQPPLPPMTEDAWAGATAAGAPYSSAGTPKEDEYSTIDNDGNTGNATPSKNDNDPRPLEHRLLDIIEQQRSQMYEMQTRLDALGGMMARMEQDVRHLRRGDGRRPWGQGARLFGGMFGQPRNEQPPDQLRGTSGEAPRRPPPPEATEVPPPRGANDPAAAHQGIFFPIFVMLFKFLSSLPHRLRALLSSTGPGRVYAHLRQRAIDQRAFANVDLASLIKLLVMLLIFTGRVGRDTTGTARTRQNNNNRRGDDNVDGEDSSMMAHAYALLQSLVEYYRVHMVVVAALIAFLVQVGLMGFFHKVVWVERDELWRAWLGQEAVEDEEEDENRAVGGDDRGVGGGGRANGDALRGNDGGNPAVGHNARRGIHRLPADAHVDEAAAAGLPGVGRVGMIRRGPNNGGLLHDIKCLFLSFFMSLVPAWRLEAVAQPEAPEEAPQQRRQQVDGAEQQGNEADGGRQQQPPEAEQTAAVQDRERDGGANGEENGAE